jgi:predicted nucleic acid-binding protein
MKISLANSKIGKMNKILVDTCLYIEWFRGNLLDHSNELLSNIPYLSSIVATELLAGAHSKIQKREVLKFISHYEDADRIISPTHSACLQAGKCIEKLSIPSKAILGDSLIAMSAKSIGAQVWTINSKDFNLIKKTIPFKLNVIPAV